MAQIRFLTKSIVMLTAVALDGISIYDRFVSNKYIQCSMLGIIGIRHFVLSQLHYQFLVASVLCDILPWCFADIGEIIGLSDDRGVILQDMMTSSNGNNFRVLAICAGNSPGPGQFPAQRPVTRTFDVFFDLRLNKRLSKQWWGWWFETQLCPLWRHYNDMDVILCT